MDDGLQGAGRGQSGEGDGDAWGVRLSLGEMEGEMVRWRRCVRWRRWVVKMMGSYGGERAMERVMMMVGERDLGEVGEFCDGRRWRGGSSARDETKMMRGNDGWWRDGRLGGG